MICFRRFLKGRPPIYSSCPSSQGDRCLLFVILFCSLWMRNVCGNNRHLTICAYEIIITIIMKDLLPSGYYKPSINSTEWYICIMYSRRLYAQWTILYLYNNNNIRVKIVNSKTCKSDKQNWKKFFFKYIKRFLFGSALCRITNPNRKYSIKKQRRECEGYPPLYYLLKSWAAFDNSG